MKPDLNDKISILSPTEMNKNAIIGMVLLVGMVLTKAYLSSGEDSKEGFFSSSEQSIANVEHSEDLRSERSTSVLGSSQLFASNFTTPSLSDFNSLKPNFEASVDANNVVVDRDVADYNNEELAEDIRPMESYSNTGYGMWMGSSEDVETIEESAPLDRGNTISDNISKLFPISH